jgi:hypothetical protein
MRNSTVTRSVSEGITPSNDRPIELKDPMIAGVLAWLIPGLGHYYQGRYFKGVLFTVCILGTFLYGLVLSGSKETGWGRSVYFSFRKDDFRLQWLCQAGIGLPTVPLTLLQWELQDKPLFDGFMAPPSLRPREPADSRGNPAPPPAAAQMSLDWIHRLLPRRFDLGTFYTMIAGLLNFLAIYDACCGPVREETKKEDPQVQGKRNADSKQGSGEKPQPGQSPDAGPKTEKPKPDKGKDQSPSRGGPLNVEKPKTQTPSAGTPPNAEPGGRQGGTEDGNKGSEH